MATIQGDPLRVIRARHSSDYYTKTGGGMMAQTDIGTLLAQIEALQLRVATGGTDTPQPKYVLTDARGTVCPDCGDMPVLLCSDSAVSAPAFYVCACGRVSQVGVGRVRAIQEEAE